MVIGILGYGVVGRGVYKIASKNNIKVKRILERNISDPILQTNSIEDIVDDPEIDTVVECLGGDDIPFKYCAKALRSGKNVVTSNKKMLVKYLKEINDLAKYVKDKYSISIAWYSGRQELSKDINLDNFDYIKLGPYIKELGPLTSKTTNQRLYQYGKFFSDYTIDKCWRDITYKFWND